MYVQACVWIVAQVLYLNVISGFSHGKHSDVKTILVFGGNGMLGASTVERLIQENHTLVLVNRGNWYWDTGKSVRPHVRHLQCDRMQSLQRCAGLQHFIWSLDSPPMFDAVIDFSAYHAFEISEALNMMNGKIKRYIYISSDSVYEVCNKSHSGFTREDDAVRPEAKVDRERYSANDDYGNRKLECEEVLRSQADSGGIPYVALRLPDVVGTRDNTYRWWIYQLWVRLARYLDTPLSVPRRHWNQPMSLVYAADVAQTIIDVISWGEKVDNQVFNLAMDETPTLVNFLHHLMDALDMEKMKIEEDDREDAFHLYPSVRLGPVDTNKAKKLLNWQPTSWKDVVDLTVKFYEDAIKRPDFERARNDVVRIVQQHLTKDPMAVIRGIRTVYNFNIGISHDEL
ncbi:uncharacterized protein LOC128226451 [Mya arenaria]|uniref:uncharacterized protein LOC128226451 n=1 Tax=Mya arenaria TaxID=6604 RepID=UPI0022E46C14|nr:uncharacterized protein LOC128226451 [Mya arenaria]